jgi:hypothetical protein
MYEKNQMDAIMKKYLNGMSNEDLQNLLKSLVS